MTNVLIHVGFPKTGTSFLQEVLWARHSGLTLIGPAGPGLPAAHPARDSVLALKSPDRLSPTTSRRLAEIADSSDERPVIISIESLVGDCFTGCEERERVAERIGALFPSASVLMTVRRQDRLIESLYAQYVHQGGVESLDGLLAGDATGAEGFSLDVFDFAEAARLFRDAVQGRLTVVAAEYLAQSPKLASAATLAPLGLSLPECVEWSRRPNQSVPPAGLALLRRTNRYFRKSVFNPSPVIRVPGSPQLRHVLQSRVPSRLLGALPGSTGTMSAEMRSRINERFDDSNRALGAEHGHTAQLGGFS